MARGEVVELEVNEEMRELIAELQGLATAAREARRELFMRADEIERKHSAVWRPYYASFDALLQELDIINDIGGYRGFLASMKRPEIAKVSEFVGISATIEAEKISDPSRRAKYLEAASERRNEKGMPWSAQEAKEMRLRIGGSEPKDSRWNGIASERLRQKEEIVNLKRELHKLEREAAELRAENEKLKKKLENMRVKK